MKHTLKAVWRYSPYIISILIIVTFFVVMGILMWGD